MERKIKRGDILYAELDGTVGSEQSGIRPVLVVQNDIGNRFSPTVVVIPLTSKIKMKVNQPTHYYLKSFGEMRYDSIVLTEQIRVIDKRRLKEKIGSIDYKTMQKIEQKIIIALGIKNLEKIE